MYLLAWRIIPCTIFAYCADTIILLSFAPSRLKLHFIENGLPENCEACEVCVCAYSITYPQLVNQLLSPRYFVASTNVIELLIMLYLWKHLPFC